MRTQYRVMGRNEDIPTEANSEREQVRWQGCYSAVVAHLILSIASLK